MAEMAKNPDPRPKRPWYSCRWGCLFWIALVFFIITIADMVALLIPAIEAAVENAERQ
jgi:hypothetical protein